MGKKGKSKTGVKSQENHTTSKDGIAHSDSQNKQKLQRQLKLSPQKRNEVNHLVEKLLKVSTSIQSTSANLTKEWETHLEIERILTKIINIESELLIPLPSRDESSKEVFMSWLESNGAEINGVEIKPFPGYELGIMAKRDLAEGEMVIGIPRNLMMTGDSVKASPLGPLSSEDTMIRHMPNVALALMLLVERFGKNESLWMPYLNMLPARYTTVLYFTTQQLKELRGSPALEPALKQCRNIARQYAYFCKLFQTISDPASDILRDVFTYEQYRWAVSTVMTRQNFVPGVDNANTVNALIPLWDICNHSNGKISTDYNLNVDRSECNAWRDFKSGEQMFILYGERSNADLLVHNGFICVDNEHDSVKLRLGVSKSDPLQPLRAQLLSKLDLPAVADFSLRCGSEPVDERLLAFLRIFSMGKDHLSHWLQREQGTDLLYPDCAMETEVEVKMWNFLLNRIKLLLASYPTSLESDLEMLKEEAASMAICQRLPIQLRIAEKQILLSAVDYVQQRSKI